MNVIIFFSVFTLTHKRFVAVSMLYVGVLNFALKWYQFEYLLSLFCLHAWMNFVVFFFQFYTFILFHQWWGYHNTLWRWYFIRFLICCYLRLFFFVLQLFKSVVRGSIRILSKVNSNTFFSSPIRFKLSSSLFLYLGFLHLHSKAIERF